MTEEGLQVRVDVNFTVLGVFVEVKPGGVGHVRVLKLKRDAVGLSCAQLGAGQLDSMVGENDAALSSSSSIDHDFRNFLALEVQEQSSVGLSMLGIERKLHAIAARVACFSRFLQAEKQGVGNVRNELVSLLSLD